MGMEHGVRAKCQFNKSKRLITIAIQRLDSRAFAHLGLSINDPGRWIIEWAHYCEYNYHILVIIISVMKGC